MAVPSLSTSDVQRLIVESQMRMLVDDLVHDDKDFALLFLTYMYSQQAKQEAQEKLSPVIENFEPGKRFDFFTFILASLSKRLIPKECVMPYIEAGATFAVRVSLANALVMMFPTKKCALQEVRSAEAAIAHGIVCVRVRIIETDGNDATAPKGRGKRCMLFFLVSDAELKPNGGTGTKPGDWLVSALLVTGTGNRMTLSLEPKRMIRDWHNQTFQAIDYEHFVACSAAASFN